MIDFLKGPFRFFLTVRVFISYASNEEREATQVRQSLVNQNYIVPELRIGDVDGTIRKEIERSDIFVFLVSPSSVEESRFTLSELAIAKEKWRNPSDHVLPTCVIDTPIDHIDEYLRSVFFVEPEGDAGARFDDGVAAEPERKVVSKKGQVLSRSKGDLGFNVTQAAKRLAQPILWRRRLVAAFAAGIVLLVTSLILGASNEVRAPAVYGRASGSATEIVAYLGLYDDVSRKLFGALEPLVTERPAIARFVFRNHMNPGDEYAEKAAHLVLCAFQQSPRKSLLLRSEYFNENWTVSSIEEKSENLLGFVGEAKSRWDRCLIDDNVGAAISADLEYAKTMGLTGPTIVVGTEFFGAACVQSLHLVALRKAIERSLGRASEPHSSSVPAGLAPNCPSRRL